MRTADALQWLDTSQSAVSTRWQPNFPLRKSYRNPFSWAFCLQAWVLSSLSCFARNETVPSNRTARIINVAKNKTSKVDINPALRELYGQLVEATVAARDAARRARENPSPGIVLSAWNLDMQIDAIIRRINQILG
jgi:hypothetical protein